MFKTCFQNVKCKHCLHGSRRLRLSRHGTECVSRAWDLHACASTAKTMLKRLFHSNPERGTHLLSKTGMRHNCRVSMEQYTPIYWSESALVKELMVCCCMCPCARIKLLICSSASSRLPTLTQTLMSALCKWSVGRTPASHASWYSLNA